MRNFLAFSFLILGFSMYSGSVSASNVDACDAVKEKGLHGLCVAWHNANPNNQEKIAEKYFNKSGGEKVPGSDPDPEDPPPPSAVCPCTEDGDIVAWDLAATCMVGPGYDDVQRFDRSGTVGTLAVSATDDGVDMSCQRITTFGGASDFSSLSEGEYIQCVTDIEDLREGISCSAL
jgi:hypothetical protein